MPFRLPRYRVVIMQKSEAISRGRPAHLHNLVALVMVYKSRSELRGSISHTHHLQAQARSSWEKACECVMDCRLQGCSTCSRNARSMSGNRIRCRIMGPNVPGACQVVTPRPRSCLFSSFSFALPNTLAARFADPICILSTHSSQSDA